MTSAGVTLVGLCLLRLSWLKKLFVLSQDSFGFVQLSPLGLFSLAETVVGERYGRLVTGLYGTRVVVEGGACNLALELVYVLSEPVPLRDQTLSLLLPRLAFESLSRGVSLGVPGVVEDVLLARTGTKSARRHVHVVQ